MSNYLTKVRPISFDNILNEGHSFKNVNQTYLNMKMILIYFQENSDFTDFIYHRSGAIIVFHITN